MKAHLLFHLALVSFPPQQRKQPAPELEKMLEKMLQESVHRVASFPLRIRVRAEFGAAHLECQGKGRRIEYCDANNAYLPLYRKRNRDYNRRKVLFRISRPVRI